MKFDHSSITSIRQVLGRFHFMKKITVGELREALKIFPDDWQVIFGCAELEFYRTKARGEKLVQIEFSQTVYATGNSIIVETHK
jgi:hypothetical protein